MTDLDQPAPERDIAEGRHRLVGHGARWREGRREGRLGEEVQDVHQHQLLVLLLMRQTQVQQVGEVARAVGQQLRHRGVHMGAIGQHICGRGPGYQAPRGARLPRAHRLVVGVEQVAELRVEHPVADQVRDQHEGLEEPGGVGQVPLGRAGVRHGLGAHVLRGQRPGQGLGGAPQPLVAGERVRRRRCRDTGWACVGPIGFAHADSPGGRVATVAPPLCGAGASRPQRTWRCDGCMAGRRAAETGRHQRAAWNSLAIQRVASGGRGDGAVAGKPQRSRRVRAGHKAAVSPDISASSAPQRLAL